MPMRTSPMFTSIVVVAAGIAVTMNLQRPPALPGAPEGAPPVSVETTTPAPPADLRAPQPSEVVQAVYRAFPQALPVDAVSAQWAVVGDFNGDGSPDLAVPARALGAQLPLINSEWGNWILQDPRAALHPPDLRVSVPRVVAREDEPLLAIVHGLGGAGWRNPEARQAYLLIAGTAGRLKVGPPPTQLAAAKRGAPLPHLRGDLIYDASSRRFLYWTGARYAWHPS
jgi:hypothetical protein